MLKKLSTLLIFALLSGTAVVQAQQLMVSKLASESFTAKTGANSEPKQKYAAPSHFKMPLFERYRAKAEPSTPQGGNITYATSCQDTVLYVDAKTSGLTIWNFGSTIPALGQYFNASQTMEISGVEFYARCSTATATLQCSVQVYLAGANKLPVGTPLATTVLTLNNTGGALSNYFRRATFTTPITVSQPYVIVLLNGTPTQTMQAIANDSADGEGEFLASMRFGTTWENSADVNIAGTGQPFAPFDQDFYMFPIVKHTLTASFTTFPSCADSGSSIRIINNDPLIADPMYNINAFIGRARRSSNFAFGAPYPALLKVADTTLVKPVSGNWNVTLTDSLRGWTNRCADTKTQAIINCPSGGPVLCGKDTLLYTLNKVIGVRLLSVGGTPTAVTERGQYFASPQPTIISGVTVYAVRTTATPLTHTATLNIYAASADSLPIGTPLATATFLVDTNGLRTSINNMRRNVVFSTPITVTGAYIVTVQNTSTSVAVGLLTNDFVPTTTKPIPDGRREWLGAMKYSSGWARAYNAIFGSAPNQYAFDGDFIMLPHVQYELVPDFTTSKQCQQPSGYKVNVSNTSSPVLFHRMYNRAYFLGLGRLSTGWNFGTGSTTPVFGKDTFAIYPNSNSYTITMFDTLYQSNNKRCIRSVAKQVVAPIPTAITTQPTTKTGCVGGSITFTVVATGENLSYQWKKGTTNVGTNSPTLVLTNLTNGNAGAYSVVVTGGCGVVTSNTFSLNITTVPAIVTQPVSKKVCPGANTTLSATASGSGISYQWRRDTTVVGVGATLNINNVSASNVGTYTVRVTNVCGSVNSNPAVISHDTSTVIVAQPQATTVCASNPATLTVMATGKGTLSYQWKKGTTNVGGNLATLTVPSVSATDTGSYTVIVTGGCGSDTSDVAKIMLGTTTTVTRAKLLCFGDSIIAGTQVIKTSGTYNYNVTGSAGCDSAITLVVSVLTLDTSFTVLGDSVKAVATAPVSVSWVKCSDNTVVGSGSKFKVPATGLYKLRASLNGCTRESACKSVIVLGSYLQKSAELNIYPNPTSGWITIECPETTKTTVSLFGLRGENVLSTEISGTEQIDLSALPKGIYILRAVSGNETSVRKLIVE